MLKERGKSIFVVVDMVEDSFSKSFYDYLFFEIL